MDTSCTSVCLVLIHWKSAFIFFLSFFLMEEKHSWEWDQVIAEPARVCFLYRDRKHCAGMQRYIFNCLLLKIKKKKNHASELGKNLSRKWIRSLSYARKISRFLCLFQKRQCQDIFCTGSLGFAFNCCLPLYLMPWNISDATVHIRKRKAAHSKSLFAVIQDFRSSFFSAGTLIDLSPIKAPYFKKIE